MLAESPGPRFVTDASVSIGSVAPPVWNHASRLVDARVIAEATPIALRPNWLTDLSVLALTHP
jgi:hypothetical protein